MFVLVEDLIANLANNFKRTFQMYIQYGGKGSDLTALETINKALQHHGLLEKGYRPVKCMAAHEVDNDAIEILKALEFDNGDHVVEHIFGAIGVRWSPEVLQHLVQLRPAKNAPPDLCKAAYDEMYKYLQRQCESSAPPSKYRPTPLPHGSEAWTH